MPTATRESLPAQPVPAATIQKPAADPPQSALQTTGGDRTNYGSK